MDKQVVVVPVTYQDKTFNVIQESGVIGGSKSRGMYSFIQAHSEYEEFVYAGPATGYAQYALAYCTNLLGKKATIFLSSVPPSGNTIPTRGAIKYGAKIFKRIYLEQVQNEAKLYCDVNPTRFLCPFGMDNDEFRGMLQDNLEKSGMPNIEGADMWVTVGSGTLLKVLLKIYPDTHFNCVIVGKQIWPDMFGEDWGRLTIYKSPLKFTQNARREDIPPYNSVKNYDAKLWYFAKKFGKSGDYIFNVAGNN